MATCFLWVTLLTPEVADVLIAGLVAKGFMVGPLGSSKKHSTFGQVCVFTALRIENVEPCNEPKLTPEAVVYHAAKDILKSYSYFSIVSHTDGGSSTWEIGNIRLPNGASTGKPALARVAGDNPLDDEPGD